MKSLCLGALIALFACEKRESTRPALVDQIVILTGQNYCVTCAVGRRGATTRCDFYGHHHALHIETALDVKGNPMAELVGETLHYVDNDESAALIDFDDYHDKHIRIRGRLFPRERMLAVESVDSL